MNSNQEQLYRQYLEMSLDKVINLRESLAIKPGEIYRLGQDPNRERHLEALTHVMLEKMW